MTQKLTESTLKEIREQLDENTTPCTAFMAVARLLGSKPFQVASKVLVATLVSNDDNEVNEGYIGVLRANNAGLVLLDAPGKNLMYVTKTEYGYSFRPFVKHSLYLWSGRFDVARRQIYLDRDRDTYSYNDLEEQHMQQVIEWLGKYCWSRD